MRRLYHGVTQGGYRVRPLLVRKEKQDIRSTQNPPLIYKIYLNLQYFLFLLDTSRNV